MSAPVRLLVIRDNGPAQAQCPNRASGEHCWHYANVQHSMMHHRDDICCFCGGTRCVNTMPAYLETRKGHGEFCP